MGQQPYPMESNIAKKTQIRVNNLNLQIEVFPISRIMTPHGES